MQNEDDKTIDKIYLKFPIHAIFFLILILYHVLFALEFMPLIYSLIYSFITIVSFMKLRDNLLLSSLAALVLTNLFILMKNLIIYNLIIFISTVLLCIIAITFINPYFEKYSDMLKKLWFIPSVFIFIIILDIIIIKPLITGHDYPLFLNYVGLSYLFLGLSYLFLGNWIVYPYNKNICYEHVDTYSDKEYRDYYCDIGKHVILLLCTFGIWYCIWIYRTTSFCNFCSNDEQYVPSYELLLCMFVPFYLVYWFSKQGERLDEIARFEGDTQQMSILYLITAIFVPLITVILMQDRINKTVRGFYTIEEI